jgi:hypothetical protein
VADYTQGWFRVGQLINHVLHFRKGRKITVRVPAWLYSRVETGEFNPNKYEPDIEFVEDSEDKRFARAWIDNECYGKVNLIAFKYEVEVTASPVEKWLVEHEQAAGMACDPELLRAATKHTVYAHPDDLPAPKRISDRELELNITDFAILYDDRGQPYWLNMPGTDDLFCAVFSTKEKAEAFIAEYKLAGIDIKQISDGPDFLESISLVPARIMVDPYRHDSGTVRFVEVLAGVEQ